MANTNELTDAQVALLETLKQSFNTAKYTDLTIKCYGTVWRVHKVIVCPQSSYLATDGTITLEENPKAIAAMLRYFYFFDYSDALFGVNDNPVMLNLLIHDLAVKFAITKLANLAAKKFRSRAKVWWKTAAFAEAALRIFSADPVNSSATLRATIVEVATSYGEVLLIDEEKGGRFYEVVHSTPELNKAIMVKQVGEKRKRSVEVESDSESEGSKRYYCRWCKHKETEEAIMDDGRDYYHCTKCRVGYPSAEWFGRPVSELGSPSKRVAS
ncbi:hypothetical protein LTR17_019029 [Elasticomyces elasticus]|nr:hypothetical protein LTR17_019029 [Elasticomyces elasticus]